MIVSSSYIGCVAITPSDTTAQFNSPAAGFMVGSAGTVAGIAADGKAFSLTFGVAGQGIDLAFTWIKVAGTSCTGIVAFRNEQFRGDL